MVPSVPGAAVACRPSPAARAGLRPPSGPGAMHLLPPYRRLDVARGQPPVPAATRSPSPPPPPPLLRTQPPLLSRRPALGEGGPLSVLREGGANCRRLRAPPAAPRCESFPRVACARSRSPALSRSRTAGLSPAPGFPRRTPNRQEAPCIKNHPHRNALLPFLSCCPRTEPPHVPPGSAT